MFYIWDCDRCAHKTLIPPRVLPSIKGDPAASSTVEPFVDFVCPQCGSGKRYLVDKIRQEEIESPPLDAILDPIDLFHESLKCGGRWNTSMCDPDHRQANPCSDIMYGCWELK